MPQRFSHYAVRRGRRVGVFTNWGDVLDAIEDFDQPEYRGFHNPDAARVWLTGKDVSMKRYDELIERALSFGDRKALKQAEMMLAGERKNKLTFRRR